MIAQGTYIFIHLISDAFKKANVFSEVLDTLAAKKYPEHTIKKGTATLQIICVKKKSSSDDKLANGVVYIPTTKRAAINFPRSKAAFLFPVLFL